MTAKTTSNTANLAWTIANPRDNTCAVPLATDIRARRPLPVNPDPTLDSPSNANGAVAAMPTRTQGTNALDPGSITSASLPTYTHRAIHAVAIVTLPVRSSEPASHTPSADVASTRYAGYMGSPSSSASEWSASSHLANTIAWRHTSKPRDDG